MLKRLLSSPKNHPISPRDVIDKNYPRVFDLTPRSDVNIVSYYLVTYLSTTEHIEIILDTFQIKFTKNENKSSVQVYTLYETNKDKLNMLRESKDIIQVYPNLEPQRDTI